jgi:hypothetical protein
MSPAVWTLLSKVSRSSAFSPGDDPFLSNADVDEQDIKCAASTVLYAPIGGVWFMSPPNRSPYLSSMLSHLSPAWGWYAWDQAAIASPYALTSVSGVSSDPPEPRRRCANRLSAPSAEMRVTSAMKAEGGYIPFLRRKSLSEWRCISDATLDECATSSSMSDSTAPTSLSHSIDDSNVLSTR